MLLTKNLSNVRLKKKLFYKFIEFFEVKDIIKKQVYYLCFFKK
jgi:hypothetical protein